MSAALATAVVAGPGAPLAAAQVSGERSSAVAAQSANRAIEIREGGLPLQVGSQGALVAHVQSALGVASDGIFGVQTDAAVRSYQLSASLEVDGIVGPATWSSMFAKASGSALGGSNVPPEVKEAVEQRLQQAGQEEARQELAVTQTETPLPEAQVQVPAGEACGSSTIVTPTRGTVTSNFGPRWGRNHDGVDIAAPTGTAVRAAACGTVSVAGQQSGYGNMACITHNSRFSTCYAHLSRFGVSNGAQVRQGQVIGYVGCTGNCTGPHLHFETRVNGQAQDPRTYLSGGSIPGESSARVASTQSQSATPQAEVVTQRETIAPAEAPETIAAAPTAEVEAEVAAPVETVSAPVEPQPVTPVETEVAVPVEAAPVEPTPVEAEAEIAVTE